MSARFRSIPRSFLLCVGGVGLVLGGLLAGFEPVGGDPDRMYRPIKQELGRFLAAGDLPWWSEQFGLGIPLLAESHVAALYPPNWVLYRLASVSAAYRLAMWSHYVMLAAAVYGLSRRLEISPSGAALAGVAFTFCGFQAIHSSHEPFYHALAYLPLVVLAAEWFAASGAALGFWLVAALWGAQLTLGHFQLQWWTGGLVLLLAGWRVLVDGRPWRRLPLVGIALALGAGIAALQLAASWELSGFVGTTHRSAGDLAFFGFPPEHLAEVVIPGLVRDIPGGPEANYWYALGTTGYEACFWVGTIPLLLSVLGLRRGVSRPLAPWLVVIVGSLILAVLPRAWPAAQALLVGLPGFGWFRAPGRYIALASLGICLLAGRGLDVATAPGTLRTGWAMTIVVVLSAVVWTLYWASRPRNVAVLGGTRLTMALATAAITWTIAVTLVLAWRFRRAGAAWLVVATLIELGWLYYTSTTVWGWELRLPEQSRVLARLAEEPQGARVAGLLHNLPARAGAAPIAPYTGFAPPPPHAYLDLGPRPEEAFSPGGSARLLRYGVTHGVWDRPVPGARSSLVLESKDPALDRLVVKPPGSSPHANWRLVRYANSFPLARAAIRAQFASTEASLLSAISYDTDPGTVWYNAADRPPPFKGSRATVARVTSFDGQTAVVEHDGSCSLVLNRTFYPGWYASVNDGEERPVSRAELGVQCVHLDDPGTSRVRLSYRPHALRWGLPISLASLGLVLLALTALVIQTVIARSRIHLGR